MGSVNATQRSKRPGGRPADLVPRGSSLGRRLVLALVVMLLPLLLVVAAGFLTFTASLRSLEEFETEIVGEAGPIETLRDLLERADDLGESIVEEDDLAAGERLEAVGSRIEEAFAVLDDLNTGEERAINGSAHRLWRQALADLETARTGPDQPGDNELDPFHDSIDEAGSRMADLYSRNLQEVSGDIVSFRTNERIQFLVAAGTFLLGLIAAFLIARRVHRTIATPLFSLREGARRLGSGELSHRVAVKGDDELAQVGRAFNEMAAQLQQSKEESQNVRGALERLTSDLEERVLTRTRDLREANASLLEAKEAAEEASRAKSRFLSRMSHELRTPLNAILGFGQILEASTQAPEDARAVDQILTAGRRLLDRINDVLDIAGADAGKLSLSLEPVATEELIKESVQEIAADAASRNVRVQIEGDGAGLHVLADRQRLKQALGNLLSNAVNHNRPGGHALISCERSQPHYVTIKVADNGPGIPPERRDDLFSVQELTGGGGVALSLAVTKSLVEAMGGSIEWESEVGAGSAFSIHLPEADDRRDRLPDGPRQTQANGGQRTVLYIEDNRANQELVQQILARREGIRLIAAPTGPGGLELALQEHPDIILLDLHLPGMSGHEILTRLRSEPATQNVPVVAISADATDAQKKLILGAGAHTYLTKPLKVGAFLDVVDELLPGEPEPAVESASDRELGHDPA